MKNYFVTYYLRDRHGEHLPTNIILQNIHPVTWAANPGHKAKSAGIITYLLFWSEISDKEVAQAGDWCSIETY